MANIFLVGDMHLADNCMPSRSRHTLVRQSRIPFARFTSEKTWFTRWQRVSEKYDLIHAFNAIPVTQRPFLVHFELFLPYIFSGGLNLRSLKGKATKYWQDSLKQTLKHQLTKDNCHHILAISDFAKLKLSQNLLDFPKKDKVLEKVKVIYPGVEIKAKQSKSLNADCIEMTFVGKHLARKGGIVALRFAKLALEHNLPVNINIISSLQYGQNVFDVPDKGFFERDLKLLDLPNVKHYRSLPNSEVLDILSASAFSLLPTIHDTFGMSVIESLATATPVISTNVCALPELVHHEVNGFVLPLELADDRQWNVPAYDASYTNTPEFAGILNTTYDRLAIQMYETISQLLDRTDASQTYEKLSFHALERAKKCHDRSLVSAQIDSLYSEILASV